MTGTNRTGTNDRMGSTNSRMGTTDRNRMGGDATSDRTGMASDGMRPPRNDRN
jgi:hypothetical protein